MNEEKNKKRCGYIYQELNYRVRGGWALLYPIVYKLRFIVMVFATLFISEQTVYSILLINLMTLLIMALLGNQHPLTPIKENYYQIFFEFVIIMEVDLMLIATMPEIDVTRKKGIGWAMVGILAVSIIVGQGMLVISSISAARRNCKLKQVRKRNLKKWKKAKTMTKKQLKENKIVYEKGIESDESIESERDLDRDTRTTNRARIILNEWELVDEKKARKKDKKAKKDRKEKKR